MYNYQAPGQYGQPPNYGAFPGQGGPPGFNAPPGIAPPGMSPPPGVGGAPGSHQVQSSAQGGFPPNFQPPANMPNINFSAPVIRLGTSGPGKTDLPVGGDRRGGNNAEQGGNRRGTELGHDNRNPERERHQMRESMMNLAPPTREEIARTIFVGNITEGAGGDDGIQRILSTAGGLRRWTRAVDSDNKPCTFGFAEFEDAESLGIATDLFKDIELPTKLPINTQNGESDSLEKSKLLVVVDDNSLKYIEEWRDRGAMKDPATAQFRFDSAKEDLEQVLANLARPIGGAPADTGDAAGDARTKMGEAKAEGNLGEVITIPITIEDELSDIPAEMRETVAKEIAAFRDRSNKRDMERLKREEEIEQAERQRSSVGSRVNRLASPPPTAPAGPAGGANGIPLGPRDRGVQGAPAGPKGFQGAQIPRDYQKGVAFVNGNGMSSISYPHEDEDSDASDEELERRRRERRDAELEKLYLDQERRWLNRERSRTAAVEREKQRDKDEAANAEKEKAAVAMRLKEWNDDVEASRKVEEYYHDRSQWLRNRATFRAREAEADDRDRAAEEREVAQEQESRNRDLGLADQFLLQQAEELETRAPTARTTQQPFKMSLGAAAQSKQAAAAPRRTIAEVEGLLEDEEDIAGTTAKRTLIPIEYDKSAGGPPLSDEERAQAARQLASDIPTDKEGLWNWKVKWEHVDDAIVSEQLRPFVEKKIVEYLGVQEQMLVDVVEECVKNRGKPQDLVGELEGALDEEAEVLVKKLWRMVVFFSESESRGLSG